MNTFLWIIVASIALSLFAWIGLAVAWVKAHALERMLQVLVSFAAGTLLAGAFLHLIPEANEAVGFTMHIYLWVLGGFSALLALEQFLHWHHSHSASSEQKKPVTYMILLADALHNFVGGVAIAGSFLVSVRTGWITWLAAAAHEIPQEFGDFGILVHGGWSKRRALLANFISALTVIAGAAVAYLGSRAFDTGYLLPFAAGNFIYIAASDLIPEIKHGHSMGQSALFFGVFILGILLILAVRLAFA